MKGLDKTERRYRFYSRYNLERQAKVDELWRMSDKFKTAVMNFAGPATWLVITDEWCVDSAHSLPLIRDAAALRDDVTLKILIRDENLDIMDLFLTNSKKAIPKFISFDADWKQQFTWGPQPARIRRIRENLISSDSDADMVSNATIEWYADFGWLEVERELIDLFSRYEALTSPERL